MQNGLEALKEEKKEEVSDTAVLKERLWQWILERFSVQKKLEMFFQNLGYETLTSRFSIPRKMDLEEKKEGITITREKLLKRVEGT